MQDYSVLCCSQEHIQIDVRVDAQYSMVNFNWYASQYATPTKTLNNGKTQEIRQEIAKNHDNTPTQSLIASTVASYVRVIHFSLSEMKNMQPEKLKNEITNRVRAILNNSESSSKYYKRSSNSNDDAQVEVDLQDESDIPNLYCVCRRGHDSILATQLLLQLGFQNVFNVKGGLTAWKDTVDPAFPMY
jgi:rhodanese-related sulfurtransferase